MPIAFTNCNPGDVLQDQAYYRVSFARTLFGAASDAVGWGNPSIVDGAAAIAAGLSGLKIWYLVGQNNSEVAPGDTIATFDVQVVLRAGPPAAAGILNSIESTIGIAPSYTANPTVATMANDLKALSSLVQPVTIAGNLAVADVTTNGPAERATATQAAAAAQQNKTWTQILQDDLHDLLIIVAVIAGIWLVLYFVKNRKTLLP